MNIVIFKHVGIRLVELLAVCVVLVLFSFIIVRYSPGESLAQDPQVGQVVSFLESQPYIGPAVLATRTTVNQADDFLEVARKRVFGDPTIIDEKKYLAAASEVTALNLVYMPKNHTARTIVVLNYHGTIANESAKQDRAYSITVDEFKKHMFALKQAGYETITLHELYLFLRDEQEIPEKSFVLTFDDGIKETYYLADPILKALNYSAAMFVITGQSVTRNTRYYLNKDELLRMQESGRWELETHSHQGHIRIPINAEGDKAPFYSNKMWLPQGRLETPEEYQQRISVDLRTAKDLLEGTLNKRVTSFALPFGDFGQRETNYFGSEAVLLDAAKELYSMVFYQFKPAINKDFRGNYNDQRKDFYLVMRISADAESAASLLSQVEAAQALPLPYTERFANPNGWISVWGEVNTTTDSVVIQNQRGTGGAMVYLDGSYPWKNYEYSATITKPTNAETLYMVGRFQDSENYVACRFDDNSVGIYSVRHKIKNRADTMRINTSLVVNDMQRFSIRVVGNTVTCGINGQDQLAADEPAVPPIGGIGVRVESLVAPTEVIEVRDIVVVPIEGIPMNVTAPVVNASNSS